MIRVLIVDDEALARRALAQLLAAHSDVVVVGECADGAEAQERLATEQVDVVFLDVKMPEVSGLDVAASVDSRPIVVFVTAHEKFGVPAFEHGALDYVLKPLTAGRLARALARVRERLQADADATRYRQLGASQPAARYLERLIARLGDRQIVIPVGELELIAADDVYAAVHAHRRRYLMRTPLDELERQLDPARFVRVHRSYIVPVDAVVALRRAGGSVVLELRNGATVPVGRRRRLELARIEAAAALG